MSKSSTKQIEETAVYMLGLHLHKFGPEISPNITFNDRGMAYDGHISVNTYTTKTKDFNSKKNEPFEIPCQVKGCSTLKKDRSSIKYKVKLEDLNYYNNNRGCLYFVVDVNSDNNKPVIYYRSLNHVYLDRVIRNTVNKKRKSHSIEFYLFPQEKAEILEILNTFKNVESKASDQFRNLDTEAVLKNPDKKFFLPLGYDNNPISAIEKVFRHEEGIYLYETIKPYNLELLIPIDHEDLNIKSFQLEGFKSRWYEEYGFLTDIRFEKNKHITTIDNELEFILQKQKVKNALKISFKYEESGSINRRIGFLSIILDYYNVIFKNLELFSEDEEDTRKELARVEKQLSEYKKVRKQLEIYGLEDSDLDLLINTKKDFSILYWVMNPKQESYIKEPSKEFLESFIQPVELIIEETSIKTHVLAYNSYGDIYFILLPLEIDDFEAIQIKDLENLTEEKFDKLLENLEKLSAFREKAVQIINSLFFYLLEIYDRTSDELFYRFCETILERTTPLEGSEEETVGILNSLQLKYRKNNLNSSDYEVLNQILNEENSYSAKLAASILLEDDEKIKEFDNLMSKEEREIFYKYPISHLIKEED